MGVELALPSFQDRAAPSPVELRAQASEPRGARSRRPGEAGPQVVEPRAEGRPPLLRSLIEPGFESPDLPLQTDRIGDVVREPSTGPRLGVRQEIGESSKLGMELRGIALDPARLPQPCRLPRRDGSFLTAEHGTNDGGRTADRLSRNHPTRHPPRVNRVVA